MKSSEIDYVAVGGADEIGMNMYLYGCRDAARRRWIAVDCGIAFGDPETTPGIETIVPNPIFLDRSDEIVEALILTHGHEDHIGALAELWPRIGRPPILATKFAAELARRKLAEAGYAEKGCVVEAETGKEISAGPFSVTFYAVDHSIPNSNLLSIRTPEGIIVHSGDFRSSAPANSDRESQLRALGDEGVICLSCESTNIFEAGDETEEEQLLSRIEGIINRCTGAVAATTFASNVRRLRTLAQAAAACDRQIVVIGRAMLRMLDVAQTTGTCDGLPEWTPKLASDSERSKLFYLVTGSQGEPRSVLTRVAEGQHPELKLVEGDTVLYSSSTIPGNERAVHRVQNALVRRGIQVVDGEAAGIHISGHAGYRELRRLYEILRPNASIPIHGEARHLFEHSRRAREWGIRNVMIAPNGSVLRISRNDIRRGPKLECNRIYREGRLLLPEGLGVIKERRWMSQTGHVAVSLVLDERGTLLSPPLVESRGAPLEDAGWNDSLPDMISLEVERAVERLSRAARTDEDRLEQAARKATHRVCRTYWGRRPVVTVLPSYIE